MPPQMRTRCANQRLRNRVVAVEIPLFAAKCFRLLNNVIPAQVGIQAFDVVRLMRVGHQGVSLCGQQAQA